MCGIVGYLGTKNATDILIDGLKRLEYRGYDSAGVAIHTGQALTVLKEAGRISVLESLLTEAKPEGTRGIAHTRWATHGSPNQLNAHPHTDMNHHTAVVHNGIIENYLEIRTWLQDREIFCVTDTDTEVVALLANTLWNGNLLDTMREVVKRLRGSYALALMHHAHPDEIAVARKDSPLVIGEGLSEMFLASDVTALLPYTREFRFLEDNQIGIVREDGVSIHDKDGKPVTVEKTTITWDSEAAEKGGWDHFMLKEMMEQPVVIRNTIGSRIADNRESIILDGECTSSAYLEHIDKIYITACGTAYHAGMVAKYLFEHMAGLPVEVEFASEFRYREPLINARTLVIVISQSGETADTLAAMREAKRRGAKVLAIVNTVGSTIAREADSVIFTWAGPEIAVASTKAYIAQLSVIHLIAVHLATVRGTMSPFEIEQYLDELEQIPDKIDSILARRDEIKALAARFAHGRDIFFLGRGFDYNIALEGSLKLKEISYIHSEAYPAGELKHGTIALIEDDTFVVALCTQSPMVEKMISNIREVKARGAVVLAIAKETHRELTEVADMTLFLPDTPDALVPILAIVPLQLFAYYCAIERGCDVDKPRNLAKSVTVE
ncbi:MAG: glutamine--fructose-6-phosphate transaminase (isomerizing) [Sphaerochaetaceae bacterium]|nr:glutamine--fructose-6-phosphate transaminase (isomerizing) [Sphaerochaetaceae bacterium]